MRLFASGLEGDLSYAETPAAEAAEDPAAVAVPAEQPAAAEAPVEIAAAVEAPVEFAVPLATFAATVGPRNEISVVTVNGLARRVLTVVPGEPDEVWLKLLAIRHRNERRTLSGWRALIAQYGGEPAHPLHPDFVRAV